MKHIDINVILTFCSDKEYGSQEIFDIRLGYDKGCKSARKLLEQCRFFDQLVQVCEDCGRLPTDLIKISTAAYWPKKGFAYDLENGKWSFGCHRGHNIAWSDNLAKLYGFGKDDDTAERELNLRALFGIMLAQKKAAAIKNAMSK